MQFTGATWLDSQCATPPAVKYSSLLSPQHCGIDQQLAGGFVVQHLYVLTCALYRLTPKSACSERDSHQQTVPEAVQQAEAPQPYDISER